jgi:hypothetical protein
MLALSRKPSVVSAFTVRDSPDERKIRVKEKILGDSEDHHVIGVVVVRL